MEEKPRIRSMFVSRKEARIPRVSMAIATTAITYHHVSCESANIVSNKRSSKAIVATTNFPDMYRTTVMGGPEFGFIHESGTGSGLSLGVGAPMGPMLLEPLSP